MKKFLAIIAVAGFMAACNSGSETPATTDTPAAAVDTTPAAVDTTAVDTTAAADTTKK
jgi:PBP1b-binding outer membrane lipoprotein LpoB